MLYVYGTIVHVKKTLNIDPKLLKDAKAACGAKTDTDAVRQALQGLVRHAAYQRAASLIGSEAGSEVVDVPRRREKASAKRKVA